MKKILRTLHVGVGGRGLWPLEHCTPENGYQPVGLCDVFKENLEPARAKTGVSASACFSDLETMIKTVSADALIICTPTITHVPYSILGFEAGLAVLVEKGMAPDWPLAKKVVEAATKAKARFCVAQNYRYKPMERTISRAVSDASAPFYVGDVFWTDYTEHRVRPERRTLSYPFASVWDMSCHHFDNLISWFGGVDTVSGQATSAPWTAYQHPNNTVATIRFKSGVLVAYGHTHDAARAELRIRVQGKRGALFASELGLEFSERPLRNFGTLPVTPVPVSGPPSELGVLEAFHRYVVEGVEPGISGRNNLEVMALCQMLVTAIEEGRTVKREELG